MITEEEFHRRKWGHRPAIHRLEHAAEQATDARRAILISDEETEAEKISRLAQIAEITPGLIDVIGTVSDPQQLQELARELDRLARDYRWCSEYFAHGAREVAAASADTAQRVTALRAHRKLAPPPSGLPQGKRC